MSKELPSEIKDMPNTDQDYIWTFKDIRELDQKLSVIPEMQRDIREIKQALDSKNHIVIDNTNKTDWKPIATIVVAIIGLIGTILLSIWGNK